MMSLSFEGFMDVVCEYPVICALIMYADINRQLLNYMKTRLNLLKFLDLRSESQRFKPPAFCRQSWSPSKEVGMHRSLDFLL